MTVIMELDSLIQLLEAEIPANPASPANKRQAQRLERELNKYFKSLEQAFPYDAIEKIYPKYVKQED